MSNGTDTADSIQVASLSKMSEDQPVSVSVLDVDVVLVRHGRKVSALHDRCQHRGAPLSDGDVDGGDLVCALHGWRYDIDSGRSPFDPAVTVPKFQAHVTDDAVYLSRNEIQTFARTPPGLTTRTGYQSRWATVSDTAEEPFVSEIRELAENGLTRWGMHGPTVAMGVPRMQLPSWDSIQIVTAQLARPPLLDGESVDTRTVIGPAAKRPLVLDIPLFVSDMSFGAVSEEAKVALARGAELARTGICSGEGGMLPAELENNTRYLYELASGMFGWTFDHASKVQAFHFKGGQGAKTGTGGHLPGDKVVGKVAEVRRLEPGNAAISPARFPWTSLEQFRDFATRVRAESAGIPVGFKLSAQHVERDIDAALGVGIDYLIIDGRGGGTGAAPALFRDNISVPTMPALARSRRHLDRSGAGDVTLAITGGIRTPADMVKAMALGADAIGLSNAALQAIGCVGMRACHTDACPVGVATQNPRLRARLPVEEAALRLNRYLRAAVDLMCVLARACGHGRLSDFGMDDLVTVDRDLAHLTGVAYAGIGPR